ncbi:MAG TPA: RluA family pseudouridine synthase [Rubricoccaceae bacterium]|nr:RluA family pseudouridine synthase [Rubricoccaceae bacterium]
MDVLHLDNHLLVVAKPAGLLAQADRTGDPDLVSAAKAYLKARFERPGDVFVGLVHRLDRPVSGVVVLARTSKAAGRLAEAFRERHVEKRYLALVEGHVRGKGEREDWLVKEDERVRRVRPGYPGAKRAALRWHALASDGDTSLVDVDLLTGRPHQARVQLAALGAPILGDLRYGARRPFEGQNLALHCYGLAFEHPVRREPLRFVAAPPPAWAGWFEGAIREAVDSFQEGGFSAFSG